MATAIYNAFARIFGRTEIRSKCESGLAAPTYREPSVKKLNAAKSRFNADAWNKTADEDAAALNNPAEASH